MLLMQFRTHNDERQLTGKLKKIMSLLGGEEWKDRVESGCSSERLRGGGRSVGADR